MNIRLIVHTLIFNDEKDVLIIKRSESDSVLPGYWDIPGGTLDFGEDPRDGAIREALEEVGIRMAKPDLFTFTSNVDVAKNTQFVRLIFIAKLPAGSMIKLNPEEHSESAWVKPAGAAPYKLVDYMTNIFSDLETKNHNLIGF